MTTNVPEPTFTLTGLSIPEESAILTGVQADYNEAFGGGLNPALNTPQGQLATSTSAIVASKNSTFAEFVNQVNPDTSTGFMQDAIARIYFLDRTAGAPTSVTCQCSGATGTVIPIGAQAQDTSGNRYSAATAATITGLGVVDVIFANIVDGPIACPPDTLTVIYQSINGWDSITNADAGVVGRLVESQSEFAYRRQQSVALNAHGSPESIYAAVFDVADVLDVYVVDNVANTTVLFGPTDYPLVAHSVYVAVVGGADQAIAEAIWGKKDLGCDYNGNTTVTVTDQSGYSPPYPSYQVTFNRPDARPILFAVQVRNSALVPSDIVALVKASIIATFTGTNGGTRARMGADIFASTFYPALVAIAPTASIVSVLLGTVTADATTVEIGIDEQPTVTAADISVALV